MIRMTVYWEKNLDNKYCHLRTDLLNNESAIPPSSPDMEEEAGSAAIMVPKNTKMNNTEATTDTPAIAVILEKLAKTITKIHSF